MTMDALQNHQLLLSLAESVATNTRSIIAHLKEIEHKGCNFEIDSSEVPSTKEYERLRIELNNATSDLTRLINGPKVEYRSFFTRQYELAAWQVALEFDYFDIVPLEGNISLNELATKAGMDEGRTMHVMRYMATQRVFKETVEGLGKALHYQHTAASATVAREPSLKAFFLMQIDETFRAASSTSDSVRQSPMRVSTAESPFAVRHGETTYNWYGSHPKEAARFAKAMAGLTQLDRGWFDLRDGFDWQSLPPGPVIDVGGGSGHISLSLAKNFTHLNFVVQDISPTMLAQGQSAWGEEFKSRVDFVQHDYFEPQPSRGASAFFARQVTHNLTDEDMIRFLRALVPALEASKPGTPLLINDTVIPEPGERTAYEEHGLRQVDLAMWILFNSKERTLSEFKSVLQEADARYKVVKVHSKGTMGLLEIHLDAKCALD